PHPSSFILHPSSFIPPPSSFMLHLFEKFGIELEYMVVGNNDFRVRPIVDRIMIARCGEAVNECEVGACGVSNELAAHVFELKSPEPTADLEQQEADFAAAVRLTNEILAPEEAHLLPGPMHPTMLPANESITWPHEGQQIYSLYDSIFNCRGHGWFNLQSSHINLPFAGDEEFSRLHCAIILILPLLPALSAASPFMEGQVTGLLDTRLDVYRRNQLRCPSITGEVIPEAVFSQEEYEDRILQPMYQEIAPFDREGILAHEWLNSRGAIARFERNAIEIRLLDVQECPAADVAIAQFIINTLHDLTAHALHQLKKWSLSSSARAKKKQLLQVISQGFDAPLILPEVREAFRLPRSVQTAGDFWKHVFRKPHRRPLPHSFERTVSYIMEEGNLATRLLRFQKAQENPRDFLSLLTRLSECLAENKLFIPAMALRDPTG
ncbi:MAG: glutamate-cysteine ligase family protein, partial [Opitutales bacterium]